MNAGHSTACGFFQGSKCTLQARFAVSVSPGLLINGVAGWVGRAHDSQGPSIWMENLESWESPYLGKFSEVLLVNSCDLAKLFSFSIPVFVFYSGCRMEIIETPSLLCVQAYNALLRAKVPFMFWSLWMAQECLEPVHKSQHIAMSAHNCSAQF